MIITITQSEISKLFPKAKTLNVGRFVKTFNNLGWLHKMTDPLELSAYLANIGQESGQLLYSEEITSGDEYEFAERLGNTEEGDGRKFKGRAWLQCTGRWNYTEFTKWYNKTFNEKRDFVANPEQLAKDFGLCQIASLWFWQAKKIKKYAVKGDFKKVVKIINGGYNGYDNRVNYYNNALLIYKK